MCYLIAYKYTINKLVLLWAAAQLCKFSGALYYIGMIRGNLTNMHLNKNVLNLLLKCTIQKIDTIFSLKMHTMNLSNIK